MGKFPPVERAPGPGKKSFLLKLTPHNYRWNIQIIKSIFIISHFLAKTRQIQLEKYSCIVFPPKLKENLTHNF